MGKRVQVVVEISDGEILGVRATREDVEVLVVDYGRTGHKFEDQDCEISRHEAEEDPEGVQQFVDATDPLDEETD